MVSSTGRSTTGRRGRELGQNFLRDPNILEVIARASELSEDDVVLEVGGGEGVLSAYLAPRVGWVHVVELDERLRETLRQRVAGYENVTLWWGDAMRVDLSAMRPRPTKMVANLPYGIAATVLLRTIEELDEVGMWLVMVQREVGERLAAAPGSRLYGVSSVLAQLAGEVAVVRSIPRTVFRPVPNVDSVLVRIVRRRPSAPSPTPSRPPSLSPSPSSSRPPSPSLSPSAASSSSSSSPPSPAAASSSSSSSSSSAGPGPYASPGVRRLVSGAFAHRRKALARSLELAGVGPPRADTRAALLELGQRADARAEQLTPAEFVALAEALGL